MTLVGGALSGNPTKQLRADKVSVERLSRLRDVHKARYAVVWETGQWVVFDLYTIKRFLDSFTIDEPIYTAEDEEAAIMWALMQSQ